MFFSVLGYVHFSHKNNETEEQKNKIKEKHNKEIGMWGYITITVVFCFVVSSVYFVNVKPILASQNLLKALSLSRAGQPVNSVLAQYDEVFKFNTFGTGEAREQLSGYVGTIWQVTSISDQDKIKTISKAIEEMEKQVERHPYDARYQIFLGSIYTKAGLYDKAVFVLNEALKLSPKKQHFYFALADVYLKNGEEEKALAVLQEAYNLEKNYEQAAISYAMVAVALNVEFVGDILEEMEGTFGSEFKYNKKFVNAYVTLGDYEIVKEIWLRAIEEEPNNLQYRLNLAATYNELGQKQNAITEIQKVIDAEPRFKEQGEALIQQIIAR